MLARTCCFALQGVEGIPVTVEAYVTSSAQQIFSIVGLPDTAVRESRDRVYAALKNNGFAVPTGRVTVSLSPADVRKEGAAFDLSIAVALVMATRQIKPVDAGKVLLLGELALDGRLVPVRGFLSKQTGHYTQQKQKNHIFFHYYILKLILPLFREI